MLWELACEMRREQNQAIQSVLPIATSPEWPEPFKRLSQTLYVLIICHICRHWVVIVYSVHGVFAWVIKSAHSSRFKTATEVQQVTDEGKAW